LRSTAVARLHAFPAHSSAAAGVWGLDARGNAWKWLLEPDYEAVEPRVAVPIAATPAWRAWRRGAFRPPPLVRGSNAPSRRPYTVTRTIRPRLVCSRQSNDTRDGSRLLKGRKDSATSRHRCLHGENPQNRFPERPAQSRGPLLSDRRPAQAAKPSARGGRIAGIELWRARGLLLHLLGISSDWYHANRSSLVRCLAAW
jgi:hypothetical protein